MNEERTPAIWALNALGLLVFFVSMMKAFDSHQPWWMIFTFIGLFMGIVRIPRVYPKKLFVFDRGDMILPAFYATLILIVLKEGVIHRVLLGVGVCAISLGTRTLINLSDRLGSRMAGGRTLADE